MQSLLIGMEACAGAPHLSSKLKALAKFDNTAVGAVGVTLKRFMRREVKSRGQCCHPIAGLSRMAYVQLVILPHRP
jgi:hypothetical protein